MKLERVCERGMEPGKWSCKSGGKGSIGGRNTIIYDRVIYFVNGESESEGNCDGIGREWDVEGEGEGE